MNVHRFGEIFYLASLGELVGPLSALYYYFLVSDLNSGADDALLLSLQLWNLRRSQVSAVVISLA